jgi:hypothetical protein
VTLSRVERFDDGFVASFDLALQDERTFQLEALEFAGYAPTSLDLEITDETGSSYQFVERRATGFDRTMTIEYACWPPLAPSVHTLRIDVPTIHLRRAYAKGDMKETIWAGPWEFQGDLRQELEPAREFHWLGAGSNDIRITLTHIDHSPGGSLLRIRVQADNSAGIIDVEGGRLEPVVEATYETGVAHRGAVVRGVGSTAEWEFEVMIPAGSGRPAEKLTLDVTALRLHHIGRASVEILQGRGVWRLEMGSTGSNERDGKRLGPA